MFDTGFDWTADGKFVGAWRIPGPDGANVEIPVLRIKSGEGPSLYINAGTHGDEFEGPIAVRKVWDALSRDDIRGTLTITPNLNVPAMLADQRISPIEGSDLNRSFPGGPDGNFAERLANIVCKTCVAQADAVMDLHAGGSKAQMPSLVVMHLPESYATLESYHASVAAAEAFGTEYIVHTNEPDNHGMLDTYVEQLGRPFVCFELGGGAKTTPSSNARAQRGVWRLLKHFDLLKGDAAHIDTTPESRHIDPIVESYLPSPAEGLFEPEHTLCTHVSKGDVIGRLYDIHDPTKQPTLFKAAADGMCLMQAARTRVDHGDLLFLMGRERTA